MRYPLVSPIHNALIIPAANARGTGMLKKCMRYAVKQPVNATIEPTERSNAPEINNNIIPTATIVSIDRLRSIWLKFSKVGKVPGKTRLVINAVVTSTMPSE